MVFKALKWSTGVKLSIFCILLTIALRILFDQYPDWAESIYYTIFYSLYRKVWDSLWSWFPIPLFYVWLSLLFGFFIYLIRNFLIKKCTWKKSLLYLFYLLSTHFIWFYWSWGFNYHRISLGERWSIHSLISEDEFLKEVNEQTQLVDSLRLSLVSEMDSFQMASQNLETQIRKLVIDFHHKNGFKAFENVRCRELQIKGSLLIWSSSGVYLPFIGESQIDGGLHKLSKPFTIAHELCHVMGWTHEGDCNFMAYLICRKSKNPFIRYSGELNYWRYLYANISRTHPDHFMKIKNNLSVVLQNYLKEINAANHRYPEIFPNMREWFYDWFLKKHGIKSGDKSYAEIIRMVINYKKR